MELTPPDIIRAAYAELVVTDLAESRRFWVDVLGFVVTREYGKAFRICCSSTICCRKLMELRFCSVVAQSPEENTFGL